MHEPEDSPQFRTNLMRFVQARTHEEAGDILDQHPELLSALACSSLEMLIDVVRRNDDKRSEKTLVESLTLLRRCREVGLGKAIEEAGSHDLPSMPKEFIKPMAKAAQAQAAYGENGKAARLDEAIDAWDGIVRHPKFRKAHPGARAIVLNDSGSAYLARFQLNENLADLDIALERWEAVRSEMSADAPGAADLYDNLAVGFLNRYSATDAAEDLEKGIKWSEQAVAVATAESESYAKFAYHFGRAIFERYKLAASLDDLDRAIDHLDRAFRAAGSGGPNEEYRAALVAALHERYDQINDAADLGRIKRLSVGLAGVAHEQLTVTVDCRCGGRFDATVWQVVDAAENPRLLDEIRQATIHEVACPECGASNQVSAPLLVFLARQRRRLIFSPAPEARDEEAEESCYRLIAILKRGLAEQWEDAWLEDGVRFVAREQVPELLPEDDEAAEEDDGNDPTLDLIVRFVRARSWKESRAICEQHPELLTAGTEELLDLLCGRLKDEGAIDEYGTFAEHRELLRMCRERGIDAAFAAKKDMSTATQSEELTSTLEELAAATGPADGSRRVDLCRKALAMLDPSADGEVWAALQANMASWIREEPDSAATVDDAIEHCRQALRVYTRDAYPENWAAVQVNLCGFYCERLAGDPAENVREGIAAAKAALEVLSVGRSAGLRVKALQALASAYRGREGLVDDGMTPVALLTEAAGLLSRSASPEAWAGNQLQLAAAYLEQPQRRADAIEQAVAHAKQGLERLEAGSAEQARALKMLGVAYGSRLKGRHSDNIEEAIDCLEKAADWFAGHGERQEQASCWINLGNRYVERQEGELSDNIERAIELFHDAQELSDRDRATDAWAAAQIGLTTAFFRRLKGDQGDNCRKAIEHGEQALSVVSEERDPQDWATALVNLASCHIALGQGTEAIQRLEAAARVFQRDRQPEEWAGVQNNLSRAYALGGTAADVERAILHANASLEVRSRIASPYEWALTQYNLGNFYQKRVEGSPTDNLRQAVLHYRRALEVNTIERYPSARSKCLAALADVHFRKRDWARAHDAYAQAIETVDALLQAAYTAEGRKDQIVESQRPYAHDAYCLIRLKRFGEAFVRLEQGKTRSLNEALLLTGAHLSRMTENERDELTGATRTLQALEAEARQPVEAGRSGRELADAMQRARATISDCLSRIKRTNPHVLPVALDLQGLLALVPKGGAVVAPVLTFHGGAFIVVPEGVDELTSEHVVRLDEFTAIDFGSLLLAPNVETLSAGWVGAYLGRHDDEATWQVRIDETMGEIWRHLIEPLHARLRLFGLTNGAPVVVLPTEGLNILPLHAAWRLVDGSRRYLLDDFTLVLAPSAYAYRACLERAQQAGERPATCLAIVDPTHDLAFALAEGTSIASKFERAGITMLKQSEATRHRVIEAASAASYLHFCCHGTHDWEAPVESGLMLAEDETLTLRDILSELRLDEARLVVLSACETGLTDLGGAPNEQFGLPTAFIQAGAGAVISTLWDVDDLSTMLLMERFYALHLVSGLGFAQALRQAQLWLRDLSAAAVLEHFSVQKAALADVLPEAILESQRRYFQSLEGGERPFRHPFYWASFVFAGSW